jgi:microcystin degradation protein MlrC
LFKEYPHTDVKDRTRELFTIIADAALGKIKPTMSLFDCRMVGGTYRTPLEPVQSFVDEMTALEGKNGVLSVSLAHGFAWADVPSNGVYTLAITDNDAAKAKQIAEELGRKFYALRYSSSPTMPGLHEALDQTLSLAYNGKPVVVADRADNAGGGAPSDSTFVLRELLNRKVNNVAVALIWDPIAVQLAMAAGVGAELQLRLGGKIGPTSGDPLDLKVKVEGIVPNLIQQWPQNNGSMPNACGDTVCLRCEGIIIIVNSIRTQVLGTELFTAFGIDPKQLHLIVVKSTQHFYAAYAPIAAEVIYMDGPGTLNEDMTQLDFKRVDKSKFPWVDDPLGAE